MTTKEILVAARTKVAQGWTQGFYAKDAAGIPCAFESRDAVCWCADGAIISVDADAYEVEKAEAALSKVMGKYLVHFNDDLGRTQAEVLAAFDKAIEACA